MLLEKKEAKDQNLMCERNKDRKDQVEHGSIILKEHYLARRDSDTAPEESYR